MHETRTRLVPRTVGTKLSPGNKTTIFDRNGRLQDLVDAQDESCIYVASIVTTTMSPKGPALGSLRVAKMSDIPRIAVVATSGLYYSPVFGWDRQFHQVYPHDTFQSYECMFAKSIRDPECIVLVVEDKYVESESDKTGATIKPSESYSVPEAGSKVIVGVATWKLEPGSARKGQYQDDLDSPENPVFDGGRGRDKNPYHGKLLFEKCGDAEEK